MDISVRVHQSGNAGKCILRGTSSILLAIASYFVFSFHLSLHVTTVNVPNTKNGFSMQLFRGCSACNTSEGEPWVTDGYSTSTSRSRPNLHSIAHATSLLYNKDVLTKFFFGGGSDLTEVSLIVDTGSEIVWISHKTPQGRLICKDSTTILCLEHMCRVLRHRKLCTTPTTHCTFREEYGGGLITEGVLVEDQILIGSVDYPGKLTFGCNNLVENTEHMENVGGILGLDNGALSFIKQLNIQKFSHCIPQIGKKGVLRFGSYAVLDPISIARISQVSLVHSAYYVHLRSIHVGNTKLPLPNDCFNVRKKGGGGFIVDSGTWWTRLISPAYDALKEELHKRMGMEIVGSNPQGLCYKYTEGAWSRIPSVSFHFAPNAIMHFDPEHIFYIRDDRFMCLAFLRAAEELGQSILGNFQMTNFEVGYDVGNAITFKRTDCSS